MIKIKHLALSLLILTSVFVASAQWQPESVSKGDVGQRLYGIMEHLVADSLEGREAGTDGEVIARNYIASKFAEIGLEPYFTNNTFYQPFEYTSMQSYHPQSEIWIENSVYSYGKDFSVMTYTGETEISGRAFFAGHGLQIKQIDDYTNVSDHDLKNAIFIVDVSFSDQYDFITGENYYEYVQQVINTAMEKEAAAVILFQSNPEKFEFHREARFANSRSSVPVIFDEGQISGHILQQESDKLVRIRLVPEKKKLTSYNVAAKIDNGAPGTIIIGAHYDHLGYGGPISRYVGAPAIHPGADDNASGVAVLIEIARLVKSAGFDGHNYVFAAFSAEEKGLIGSKAFVDDTLTELPDIVAMINIDMVGRLDPDVRKLNVLNTGTSTKWDSLLQGVYNPEIDLMLNPKGSGGSDHMSFFLKNIPVLFFITGLHEDYHTPSDVLEKINIGGMTDITILLTDLIFHISNVRQIPFVQVENTESRGNRMSRSGSVTLGIIPDHAYGGKGLRIDAVTTGRSAQLAGLMSGDIIIAIDEHDVSDITSYMRALAAYQPGNKAVVSVIRNDETLVFDVTF